nr:hypothetical protein CFP56_75086 [Quercus suber]
MMLLVLRLRSIGTGKATARSSVARFGVKYVSLRMRSMIDESSEVGGAIRVKINDYGRWLGSMGHIPPFYKDIRNLQSYDTDLTSGHSVGRACLPGSLDATTPTTEHAVLTLAGYRKAGMRTCLRQTEAPRTSMMYHSGNGGVANAKHINHRERIIARLVDGEPSWID